MAKYDTVVDIAAANSSHSQLVRLAGKGKRVLDVGCATGYVARALVGRGCRVSGVEFDKEAAEEARPVLEKLVISDLESLDFSAEFEAASFDAIIFGDVLEHLRDPAEVLRRVAPLLAEGGSVLMSVPNVAHGDVRLHLLAGEWEYRPLGLLDETHLRFFTRQSLIAMIHDAGYAVASMDRTTIPMFETEIGVVREHFPAAVVDHILADPDATTYQFIVRAVPMDGASRPAVLQEIVDDQTGQIDRLRRQLAGISADRERLIRHVRAMENRRIMRYTSGLRRIYGSLRRAVGR